jgi:hypothetical protein
LFGHGLRQVGDGEMTADAGVFMSRVSECGLSSEDGVLGEGLGGVSGAQPRGERKYVYEDEKANGC